MPTQLLQAIVQPQQQQQQQQQHPYIVPPPSYSLQQMPLHNYGPFPNSVENQMPPQIPTLHHLSNQPIPQDIMTMHTKRANPILEICPKTLSYLLLLHGYLASGCVADVIPNSIVKAFGQRLEWNGLKIIPCQTILNANAEPAFFWAIPTPRYAYCALRAKEQGLFDFIKELSVLPTVEHTARIHTPEERNAEFVQLEQVKQTAQFIEKTLQEAGRPALIPLGPPTGVQQPYHISQNEPDLPLDYLGIADLAPQIRRKINAPVTDIQIPELRPPSWPLPPMFRSTDRHLWPWKYREETEQDPVALREAVGTKHVNSQEAIVKALRNQAASSQSSQNSAAENAPLPPLKTAGLPAEFLC